jgi:hypothetical protein
MLCAHIECRAALKEVIGMFSADVSVCCQAMVLFLRLGEHSTSSNTSSIAAAGY